MHQWRQQVDGIWIRRVGHGAYFHYHPKELKLSLREQNGDAIFNSDFEYINEDTLREDVKRIIDVVRCF